MAGRSTVTDQPYGYRLNVEPDGTCNIVSAYPREIHINNPWFTPGATELTFSATQVSEWQRVGAEWEAAKQQRRAKVWHGVILRGKLRANAAYGKGGLDMFMFRKGNNDGND
jgi:hypothetical protein